MTPVVAHAGHWLVNLLYLAPVIFIVVVIVREKLKDRGDGVADSAAGRDADPDQTGRE